MMTKKFKEELETKGLEQAKQRRMEFTLGQKLEVSIKETPTFVGVTKRINDSERRLINFISKALSIKVLIFGVSDSLIL